MPGSMRFARAGAGVEESGGLSQPVERPGARRGHSTPSGHEPSLARAPADSSCDLGGQHAACRDHSRTHRRRSTPASPATPAWRPAPPPPQSPRGRTVGSTTPGRRSAHGHDVPPPRRRGGTNCRSRGFEPTVPAPSASTARHVVTTRARTRGGPPRPPRPLRPGGPPHHRREAHAGDTVGSTTPGRRSARGHDVPPPRRRVVTNCRSHCPQPTVRAPSAPSTRHVVTTRAGTDPGRTPQKPAPGNTKRGRPEGRPRGGVWRESC